MPVPKLYKIFQGGENSIKPFLYISSMKKALILFIFAFAAGVASAQDNRPAKRAALTMTPVPVEHRAVNRRFLNNGNTLLNMAGSIPEPAMVTKRPSSGQQQSNIPSAEKLVTRNLLFTGKLSDHISRPFMVYPDSLSVTPRGSK
jgi:hypothetical protein